MTNTINNTPMEFNPEKSFIGIKNILEIDNNRKLFRIRPRHSKGKTIIYRFAHLGSAEHFKVENDVTVTKIKPGDALERAAVGGLLFGGVGAIVGGTTAEKTVENKTKLKRQYIRLYLNSKEHPTFDLNIKCTTDGKRIAEQLFAALQSIVDTTSENERNDINTSGIKPIVI